jgi:aminoglycoside 3-N-acetyltransferase|tara:strand:+ start:14057 stop:14818 length:762 start_codon:yes stop_codon:yes gene_type:complete
MLNLFSELEIVNEDKVLVSSDILPILIRSKNKSLKKIANDIIDELLEKVGKNGTIIIPTYNWDFCKGKTFDYHNTLSSSGALGNIALKRDDFLRSKNAIYSFAVAGKDKVEISELNHVSSFGLDSAFGHLIKNNGKNLFINLDYKLGFTFCHVAEETVGVSYRYQKKFKGSYIDKKGDIFLKEYSMYVRDLDSGVKKTLIHKDLDNILLKHNGLKRIKNDLISLDLVDIKKAYEIMVNDLKSEKKIIYTEKNE